MTGQFADDAVLRRLCELAAEQANVDPSTVMPESDFFQDLNFDSLDKVEYAMKIEDEFDVSIEDEAADKVRTPAEAWEMLRKMVTAAGSGKGNA